MLAAKTPGEKIALVDLGGGIYEAATYDQDRNITFWRYQSQWSKLADSRTPTMATDWSRTPISVQATTLPGMTHALYLVHGPWNRDDGTVAYTTGANGWGLVVAQPDSSLASTGQPADDGVDQRGVEMAMSVSDGQLHTQSAYSTSLPLADNIAAEFPLRRAFRWDTDHFTMTGDNIFTAQSVDQDFHLPLAPLPGSPSNGLRAAADLPDGVWGATVTDIAAKHDPGTVALSLAPTAIELCHYPQSQPVPCSKGTQAPLSVTIDQDTPMILTGSVTGPAFLMSLLKDAQADNITMTADDFTTLGKTPYYLPPSLADNLHFDFWMFPGAMVAVRTSGGHITAIEPIYQG